MKLLQNKKGFTLIELIIVVVILGILSRLAVPNVQEAVKTSRIKVALQNIKTVQDTIDKFYIENGRFPSQYDDNIWDWPPSYYCEPTSVSGVWVDGSTELDNKLGKKLSSMGIGYIAYPNDRFDYSNDEPSYIIYLADLPVLGLKHEDVYNIDPKNIYQESPYVWSPDTDALYAPPGTYSYFPFKHRHASDI